MGHLLSGLSSGLHKQIWSHNQPDGCPSRVHLSLWAWLWRIAKPCSCLWGKTTPGARIRPFVFAKRVSLPELTLLRRLHVRAGVGHHSPPPPHTRAPTTNQFHLCQALCQARSKVRELIGWKCESFKLWRFQLCSSSKVGSLVRMREQARVPINVEQFSTCKL